MEISGIGPLPTPWSFDSALKLFTSDWDLNPHGWDSDPAKTHSTWFQDLMKLRFLMSHDRKNSVRDKVIVRSGFIQIQREAHSTECGPWKRVSVPPNLAWLVFISWVNFIC